MAAMVKFLSAARLDQYSAALQREYGAACVADLAALEENDLSLVGMKKIEGKRLQRQLERSERGADNTIMHLCCENMDFARISIYGFIQANVHRRFRDPRIIHRIGAVTSGAMRINWMPEKRADRAPIRTCGQQK